MILIDKQIKAIGKSLINPYDESLVNPSSVDIRIGNKLLLQFKTDNDAYNFYLSQASEIRRNNPDFNDIVAKMNNLVQWAEKDISNYTQENPFWLFPESKILVESLETFYFPDNICGQFRLKSSRGREFYEHLEAGWIDIGWHGSKLTMEIENRSLKFLPIYPHLKIGQIILFQTDLPENSYKITGRYNNDSTVQRSKG